MHTSATPGTGAARSAVSSAALLGQSSEELVPSGPEASKSLSDSAPAQRGAAVGRTRPALARAVGERERSGLPWLSRAELGSMAQADTRARPRRLMAMAAYTLHRLHPHSPFLVTGSACHTKAGPTLPPLEKVAQK